MSDHEREFNACQAQDEATKLGRKIHGWLLDQARQGRRIEHAFDERSGRWTFQAVPAGG